MSLQTSSAEKDSQTALRRLERAVSALQKTVARQQNNITSLEKKIVGIYTADVSEPDVAAAESVIAEDSTAEENTLAVERSSAQPVVSLEERLGGNWFAKIGIAALVIGVAFFLKYAFDNDWIGETGRVVLGVVAGVAMLGAGERIARSYAVYGQLLSGGGLIVLYLSVFAAFSFYTLISYPAALVVMALITAAGVVVSLRYDGPSVLLTAMVGGFAVPFLLWNDVSHQGSIFSFVLLLDAAVLVVSTLKQWRILNIVGFVGTATVFLAWYLAFYTPEVFLATMLWLTLFFVLYSFSPIAYNLVKAQASTGSEQLLTFFVAAAYATQGYIMLIHQYDSIIGFCALLLALYYLVLAFVVRHVVPSDSNLYDFIAFLSAAFVTLAVSLQFDGGITTVGWAIELVVLVYLTVKLKKDVLKILATLLLALIAVKLLFIDSFMDLDSGLLILNKRFFTFLFAAAAMYVGGFLCVRRGIGDTRVQLATLIAALFTLANIVTLFAGSQEILTYYDARAEQAVTAAQQLQLNGYDDYWQAPQYRQAYEQARSLRSQSSIVLSLFWLVYAIVVIVVGFAGRYKMVRLGGMLLLVLAIVKLFFYDLWNLGTLYRIISSISLGVVLLVISFAYQKFKDKLQEIL